MYQNMVHGTHDGSNMSSLQKQGREDGARSLEELNIRSKKPHKLIFAERCNDNEEKD